MEKILRRALACVLCGMLACGFLGFPAIAAGEGEAIAAIKTEYQVIPALYPNPFNVPYEDFFSKNSYMHLMDYLDLTVNGKDTIMIATEDIFTLNYDFTMRSENRLRLDNAEMAERIARVKKAVSIMPELIQKTSDFLFCIEYYDFITFMPIGVTVNGSIFIPNEKFFKNKEIVEIGKYISHDEYMKKNSLNYNSLGLSEELLDRIKNKKPISSEEIFQVYFKVIPQEYWPIITESKINVNSTLPVFKDEILDKELDKNEIGFCIIRVSKIKGDTYRIQLLKSYSENQKFDFFDYFVGVLTSNNGKTENEDFLKKLNVEDQQIKIYGFLASSADKQMDQLLRTIPNQMDEFMLIKTHRDLVNWYQKIPLDMQIDYSFYDFHQSPILDEYDTAWLANRPAPPPTPTLPPYVELRIGSSGQEVLDMKQRFFELGYFRTDKYNDQYSQNTADTVKLFEQNNGLPVDGVADVVMLGLLFSDSAVGK